MRCVTGPVTHIIPARESSTIDITILQVQCWYQAILSALGGEIPISRIECHDVLKSRKFHAEAGYRGRWHYFCLDAANKITSSTLKNVFIQNGGVHANRWVYYHSCDVINVSVNLIFTVLYFAFNSLIISSETVLLVSPVSVWMASSRINAQDAEGMLCGTVNRYKFTYLP